MGDEHDQVVIGSCTNGRIRDMRVAAQTPQGTSRQRQGSLIVIPGTQQVVRDCLKEGAGRYLYRRGAIFTMPTCGPCLGGFAAFWRTANAPFSTTNRKLCRTHGSYRKESFASLAVAAAFAIMGVLPMPGGGAAVNHVCSVYGHPMATMSIRRLIIPARYLNTLDHAELPSHCMEDLDSAFKQKR